MAQSQQLAAAPFTISKKSQELLRDYHRACLSMMSGQWNFRAMLQQIDREYYQEVDWTDIKLKAKQQNVNGNPYAYQSLVYPIVMPQVEAAVTYQTSVFLTGQPIFGVVSAPKYAEAAIQLETKIDAEAVHGGWRHQLINFFRNGFKYSLSATEINWEVEKIYSVQKDGKLQNIVWQGNKLTNLDMYNTFFDCRVHPLKISSEGEFAGYTMLKSRIGLKQYLASLPYVINENIPTAFASPANGLPSTDMSMYESYFIPQLNPDALIMTAKSGETNWLQWLLAVPQSGNGVSHSGLYEVSVHYLRICPEEFEMKGNQFPASDQVQIWKFIFVNHQVLVYAERLTNAHGLLPILFSVPRDDGIMYQTKSDAMNARPFQYVATTMINSMIASRRRAISDRVLYDPSRIGEAQINSANPSAKIPVRPAAYGKNISEAVYAFPYNDNQAGLLMQEMSSISSLADVTIGHNKAQQGQFVKGNKTRHEYDDIMSHAAGRDQTASIVLEDQYFTPLKMILKTNIIQYQGADSIYSRAQKTLVNVDPVALREAILEFKISDGLIPSDKLIDADSLSVAIQTFGSSPQLAGSYDLGGLTTYLLKMRGADLQPFEKSKEQVAYEQAMGAWQGAITQAFEMLKLSAKIADKMPLDEIAKYITSVIPPQPKPQDYGYQPNPAAPTQAQDPVAGIIAQALPGMGASASQPQA